jgi:AraC-like DNA-binding protein
MINLYEAIREHPEYFKQLSCKGMLFTQYDCPQESAFQDLFSEQSFIVYVVSGKRTFYVPGEKHLMTEGKCAFVKKGAWIAEKEAGDGWCVLVFFMPDLYITDFVKGSRSNFPLVARKPEITNQVIELEVNEITKTFFHSMVPYFSQVPRVPEDLLELKFRELLFNILINPANSAMLAWTYSLADNPRHLLQQIMDANYLFNLSLADYARISGRSLAGFKRDFQQIYHTSPGRWLTIKRLDHASLLLSTSVKNINEVAFESGFENAAHFSRLFKSRFGATPSAYRNTAAV